MQQLATNAIETDFAGLKHDEVTSTETAHGRTEERSCDVIEIPKDHHQRALWKDLRTLVIITTRRVHDERETWETRLYISSHGPRAKALARAVRKHWSIENS